MWQKILLTLMGAVLFIVILVGLPLASVSKVVTSSKAIAGLLLRREVYDALASGAQEIPLAEIGADPDVTEAAETGFDPEALAKIIDRYFTYDFYQRAIGEIIPATYTWLDGTTDSINFSIVITEDRAEFKNFILDIFTQRYKSLPVCKITPPSGDFNPFASKCRLRSFTDVQVRNALADALSDQELEKFFTAATLDSDEFFADTERADSENMKKLFSLANRADLFIYAAILALSGLVILIIFDKTRWAKILGITLIVPSGIVLLMAVGVLAFKDSILETILPMNLQSDSQAQYQILASIIDPLVSKITFQLLLNTAALGIIAIGLLYLGTKISRPHA